MKGLLRNLFMGLAALFLIAMLILRLTEGSFAGAGARVDTWLGVAVEEADAVARDLADGPDDSP